MYNFHKMGMEYAEKYMTFAGAWEAALRDPRAIEMLQEESRSFAIDSFEKGFYIARSHDIYPSGVPSDTTDWCALPPLQGDGGNDYARVDSGMVAYSPNSVSGTSSTIEIPRVTAQRKGNNMATKQITLYWSDEMASAVEAHKIDNGYQSVQDTAMRLLTEALADHGRQVSYETPQRGGNRRKPVTVQTETPGRRYYMHADDWRLLSRIHYGAKVVESATPNMGMPTSFTVGRGRIHWNGDILDKFAALGLLDRPTYKLTDRGVMALTMRESGIDFALQPITVSKHTDNPE